MVRCKACGHIMPAGKLGDRCPACGAPRSAFEPYTDPMSANRRRILNIELHPIAVHFPVSFVVAVFLLTIIIPCLSGGTRTILTDAAKILAAALPVVVILAGVLGWIDGKIRFRKIKVSQILKRKIVYASVLFVVAVGWTVLVWMNGLANTGFIVGSVLLGAACLALVILLGLLGVSINNSAFPGK